MRGQLSLRAAELARRVSRYANASNLTVDDLRELADLVAEVAARLEADEGERAVR